MNTRPLVGPLLLTVILVIAACASDNPTAPGGGDDSIPADFVFVPAGTFTMGSPISEPGRTESETPHQVTLTHDFWMKAHEVTNEEYRQAAQWALEQGLIEITGDTIRVLRDVGNGKNFFLSLTASGSELDFDAAGDSLVLYDVGFGINPDHPIKYLTWWGGAAYCNWRSLIEGREPAYDQTTWEVDLYNTTGYRLPTEAEWEYAARGGNDTSFGDSQIMDIGCGADSLQFQGWYCFNAEIWTNIVGRLAPNGYGLYDMHGNVWEFCNDWYEEEYYAASPDTNPAGPDGGPWLRSARGGSWGWGARYARAASRGAHFMGMVSPRESVRPVLVNP
ncbi:MAG: SUMF1/EgtB/PvdO family nonheme iron enzyme [Candidatus Krumholzibacteria bacterium]|nr:SUMF1/EgtB/PvdO family nonheme iron enzyme [Candidatus Krumholzibacteria bacterium]